MIARTPGGGFRLGWNDAKGRTHLTPLSEDLRSVGPDIQSTLVDAPLGMRNDLARFANGDVGWLTATRGASGVTGGADAATETTGAAADCVAALGAAGRVLLPSRRT